MATSEIEKLERRYAENPHGLTFAPLAEVHRKNGDVARALELLRVGLELHPNYIPASIVLGRCHQDLGDLPAAEGAFGHVLRLDDENVIALKCLADINERQDRLDEAEQWLRRLVSVDRSNDEARQQLRRVETLKESRGRPASPPSPDTTPEVPHEIAVTDEEPPARTPVVAETAAAPPEPADLEPLQLTDEVAASAPGSDAVKPPEEPVTAQEEPAALEPAALKPPVVVPAALQDRVDGSDDHTRADSVAEPERAGRVDESGPLAGLISGEFQPPVGPPSEPIGLDIETEDDVVLRSSGASEFSVPDASQDLAALAAKLNASRPRSPGRRASDRAAGDRLAAQAKSKGATPAPQQPEPAPEPIAAPRPLYSASATKGQSIAAFFQALLVARPPADPAAPTSPASPSSTEGGAPTRPAQDELSLSSVFGEDGTSISPVGSSPGPAKDAGVSFDDFFGSSGRGTSPLTPGGTEPGKDDLDQFHSWLQNLKR